MLRQKVPSPNGEDIHMYNAFPKSPLDKWKSFNKRSFCILKLITFQVLISPKFSVLPCRLPNSKEKAQTPQSCHGDTQRLKL